MNLKRLITAFIISAAVAGATAAADMYATRGEVADMLLTAADDYNPNVKRSDIIKGYGGDGELHEDWNINRAEALVMLSRAFGKLPELSGHNARVALKSEAFTDIPDWAANELKPVLDAGLAAGTGEGTFSPYDDVTKEQMNLFIKRAYALFGTNEKDDFYAAVNKDALNKFQILPGHVIAGTFYDLGDKSAEEVSETIDDAIEKGGEKGSKEQKIADFYNNILDKESRNRLGISQIKPYLDMIDNVKNLNELTEVQSTLQNEIYLAPFAAFSITIDLKDSTKYIPVFGTTEPGMTKDFYTSGTEAQKNAYLKYLKSLLEIAGESDADDKVRDFYEFEKRLAEKSLNPEDAGNVDKIYNTFTLSEISDMFPTMDITCILKDSGIKEEEKILISDVELAEEFSSLFKEENLSVLKTSAKLSLLTGFGSCLSQDFTDVSNTFSREYLGVSGEQSDVDIAVMSVSSVMPDYIGELYAERYFTEEAKQNAEKMVDDIISVYKDRIKKLTWMSEETKKKALNKLEKMNKKIGYPDEFETYLDNAEIKSFADGGSCFDNIIQIAKAANEEALSYQGKTVDKTKWLMYPYTVNACYDVTSNDITFPAAILQPPMYDVNASYEENLGGIGYIIAHEITHAFDNNGAKFDENGNAADWWTPEDYAEFEKLCDKVIQFYDGQEGIAGIPMNGRLTLSENVSDLGAVQCITEVASRLENPDYQKLYRAIANSWASTKTREYASYAAGIDVHSEDKLRVNRVIVNCDEFYKAFGISENDGMYVAPENRICIW